MNKPRIKIVKPLSSNQAWKRIAMPLHIVIAIFGLISASAACLAYVGMSSPNDRFIRIEERQDKTESEVLPRLYRIEQKVDIMYDLMKKK